jgi:capsular polysaccharide transport system permease protein
LRRSWALFLGLVAVPIAIAGIYWGSIASDIYVSETRFIVRSATHSDLTGLAALVQNHGMSRAAEETYAVNEYFRSRDALRVLLEEHQLAEVLSRPEADFISRFPNFYSKDTQESLYRHFRSMVTAEVEASTGISRLEVAAFRSEDARRIASALLASAESLINRLNDRANRDALNYANELLDAAARKVNGIERQITEYRQRERLIDVSQETVAAMETFGRLSIELAQSRAALDQQLRLAPSAPSVGALRERISAMSKQVDEFRSKIVGADDSIVLKMQEYELLLLQRELAAKGLGLAMLNVEKAKQNSQLQYLYLQTIATPNAPDEALYPKRLLWFSVVAVVTLLLFWTVSSLFKIVMEHQS